MHGQSNGVGERLQTKEKSWIGREGSVVSRLLFDAAHVRGYVVLKKEKDS